MGFLQEISEQIGSGRRSPVDLVDSCLEAIRRREGGVKAWAYIDRASALREAQESAREIQASGPRSPLHGIPVGIKDIFDTADMPTEWGAEPYKGRRPEADAGLVAQLRELGAIVLGKTHTTAFAYFDPGPTRNPAALEHTPGGSSSGSAAAVAAGMAPLAVGSQTMGSVLRPASFCGVVGFKPTFGKLSLEGVLPFAPSLDHAGLFTHDAEDMAFVWEALTGEKAEPDDSAGIAALPWPPVGSLEREMEDALQDGLERLRKSGLQIEKAAPPKIFRELPDAILAVLAWEAAEIHRERLARYGDRMGRKLAELVRRGMETPQSRYEEARETIGEASEAYREFSRDHAVCLTPAALGPAPAGILSTGDPRANAPWTALGVPAIAIRLGRSPEGLPLGLQISAWRNRDGLVLSTAKRLERALSAPPG